MNPRTSPEAVSAVPALYPGPQPTELPTDTATAPVVPPTEVAVVERPAQPSPDVPAPSPPRPVVASVPTKPLPAAVSGGATPKAIIAVAVAVFVALAAIAYGAYITSQ